jgi:hypothetical protein
MPTAGDYRLVRFNQWVFWVLDDAMDSGIVNSLAAAVDQQDYSKHPQTLRFTWPPEANAREYFLKVFHRGRGATIAKDLLRWTKARRFWRQGLSLDAAGFNVPRTIVCGEKRRRGLPERSLVLTDKIDGTAIPTFLSEWTRSLGDTAQVKLKWRGLAQLGELVRRFHDLGFVHGDLVATNIFVVQSSSGPRFYLMDNDRTQRFPARLTMNLRKRNLVQLNRMPLAHINLQDRMRFLRSYLKVERVSKSDRDFAVWLERKTRQRRGEVDRVDTTVTFRKLMAS